MVKAGVFLLARFSPLLGGTELWMQTLTAVGAVTAVHSAFVSLGKSDLKQVLAYTTVMALGICVMFLGSPPVSGAGEPSRGVLAALAFLVAHALYKAALFMIAGTIEKATGTRDLTRLGGLRTAMPVTFVRRGCRVRLDGRRATLGRIHRQGAPVPPSASRPTRRPTCRGRCSSPPRQSRPLRWSFPAGRFSARAPTTASRRMKAIGRSGAGRWCSVLSASTGGCHRSSRS